MSKHLQIYITLTRSLFLMSMIEGILTRGRLQSCAQCLLKLFKISDTFHY
jgi:hypothetical protein